MGDILKPAGQMLGGAFGGPPGAILGGAAGDALGGLFGGGGGRAFGAAKNQFQEADAQAAETANTETAANGAKSAAERAKIMQDTQTKITEMIQEVAITRSKSADKIFNLFDQAILA